MPRYGASKQEVENLGNRRYLVYLISNESEEDEELIALLSKHLGVPTGKIQFKSNGFRGVKIFEII